MTRGLITRYLTTAIFVICAGVLTTGSVQAMTTLTQVKITDSDHVTLLFDKKISRKHINVEYFRDIIQLSIKNVSVYPAKILTVKGDDIKKVFAYQYTPALIRCRLTMDKDALKYKNRIRVRTKGRLLNIQIIPEKTIVRADTIKTSAAAAVRTNTVVDPKETELLSRVMKGMKGATKKSKSKASEKLTNAKPLPNPLRSFGWLAILLVGIGFTAFVVRHLRRNGKVSGLVSKMVGGKLAGRGKMIEIVSTHHLGPKKSICIIKVQGNLMVLGITNESINLISRLSDDFDGGSKYSDGPAAMTGPESHNEQLPEHFADMLPNEGTSAVTAHTSGHKKNVRDGIRMKVRGMKNI